MNLWPMPHPVSRRAALTGLPLLAGGLAFAGAAPARAMRPAAHAAYDLDDPVQNLRLYMKMQYSLVREPVYAYFAGHIFAMEGDQPARLLFEVEGFGHGWAEPQADGSFHLAWKELAFYKDPVTGAILDQWHNPLTDEDVAVTHIMNPAANAALTPRAQKVDANFATSQVELAGNNYRHPDQSDAFVLPWQTIGGWTSVWQDVRLSMKHVLDPKIWVRESSGERISIGEFFQLTARTDELFDPARNSVDHVGAWVRVASWHPWMLMGQRPGKLFYRCSTNRLRGLDELPAAFHAEIVRRQPTYLDPPVRFGPRYSTWKTFLATHKPLPPRTK